MTEPDLILAALDAEIDALEDEVRHLVELRRFWLARTERAKARTKAEKRAGRGGSEPKAAKAKGAKRVKGSPGKRGPTSTGKKGSGPSSTQGSKKGATKGSNPSSKKRTKDATKATIELARIATKAPKGSSKRGPKGRIAKAPKGSSKRGPKGRIAKAGTFPPAPDRKAEPANAALLAGRGARPPRSGGSAGASVRDLILEVLRDGEAYRPADLARAATALGWTTESTNKATIIRNNLVTMRMRGEIEQTDRGWRLVPSATETTGAVEPAAVAAGR